MRPTEKVLSASVSSIRVFQNRILSGNPSRSRGPGRSSRKKSASWASKERRPLGTILMVWWSEVGMVGVTDGPGPPKVEGDCPNGEIEGEQMPVVSVGATVRHL